MLPRDKTLQPSFQTFLMVLLLSCFCARHGTVHAFASGQTQTFASRQLAIALPSLTASLHDRLHTRSFSTRSFADRSFSAGISQFQRSHYGFTNPWRAVHGIDSISTTRLFASASSQPRNNQIDDDDDDDDDDNDGWKVPSTVHIPEESLDLSFVRSSGAGGQNVNKVNTQVQLKVLIDGMGWVPYEVRERLRQQQANRINKEGFLVLQVQEYRTQPQNRKAAVDKLREMILQAWPRPKKRKMRTGISPKTKKQRREDKRKRSLVKESRRRVDF